MRIEVRQILSLKLHEASCHLLIMGDVYVLLDCGISPSFDFSLYRGEEEHLKKVSLVLISHPSIQYLGALPFLLTEFKISPKIFTTKPISQLGPLNIHEALLYLRNPKYTPEVYEKICNIFQDSVLKPLQKKVVRIKDETDNNKKQQSADSIQLVCYNVGNTIGSVCWRISYFMFNCLYLIGYNNYSQYHLSGMDVQAIVGERTDLIITDCYEEQKEEKGGDKDKPTLRKEIVKKQIQEKWLLAKSEGKQKVIFACYENERIVQLACILVMLHKQKKLDCKIDFVHSESMYLQSVRIYPELQFKMNEEDQTLFNTRFLAEGKLQSKIILTTGKAVQPEGMIWPQLCSYDRNKTTLIHFGQCNSVMNSCLDDLRELFNIQKPETQVQTTTIMEIQNVTEPQTEKFQFQDLKQIRADPYIYNNGTFPKFQPRKQYVKQFDGFGEQYRQPQQAFVEQEIEEEKPLELEKKKSSFSEDRKRIFFEMPPTNNVQKLQYDNGTAIKFNGSITNFQSSIHILSRVKAEKNLFINCDNREYTKYQMKFRSFDKKMEIFGIHKKPVFYFEKPYEVIDLPVKLYQENDGQTLALPSSGTQAVRVNGQLVQLGNQLQIRLQRSEEKELRQFNLANFYKSLKGIQNTRFTENGIVQIGGIKMSLRKGQISIQGVYSNEYYKLRQMLYEYIESS